MKNRDRFSGLLLLAVCLLGSASAAATRIMERLDRGVVVLDQPDGKVFVSRRLLASDPGSATLNFYRTMSQAPDPVVRYPAEVKK